MCSRLLVLGRARCFKKRVSKLRSVCGEPPRPRLAPKLLSTRKPKSNINGLPILGELCPVVTSFKGHWDALFLSMKVGKKRFLSFPPSGPQIISPPELQTKPDLLDWLAQVSERIRPYSAAAFGIALASIALATLLLFMGRASSAHVSHFGIYLPAILATGLLAGVPAALGVVVTSLLIIVWAFMPPYFEFKWPSEIEQINIFFNAVPYLITVYFAYLCRAVLQRLRRGELNNRILTRELEHRGRNLFSVLEVIVQKTLSDN